MILFLSSQKVWAGFLDIFNHKQNNKRKKKSKITKIAPKGIGDNF